MALNDKEEAEAQRATEEAHSKRPYEPPRLEVHGAVDDVTEAADGSVIGSDRGQKTDFALVDVDDILERLARMPIQTWPCKES